MGLFQKKIGTVFLKETSDSKEFVEKMEQLEQQVEDAKIKQEIQKQIKLAQYGALGEDNISFELKNSGMDMYVLHDIYLEHEDLSAQIDYLIITRKLVFVIECKNLIGNIEIDEMGNFVRTYELFGKKIKEGIYSPITQNQRHLNVLKNVRLKAKKNIIMKHAFEYYFEDSYKSLIVLANPKTYLNSKKAPSTVKEQVIRADCLIQTIRDMNRTVKDLDYTEKEMLELAEFFLNACRKNNTDYTKKYEEMVSLVEEHKNKAIDDEFSQGIVEKQVKNCPKCGKELILRTAKNGEFKGNQFYGCSGYPKCRYIENI